jgi:hypothetical protein
VTPTPQTTSYAETVTRWADHLRAGGTTTWSAWLDRHDEERVEPTVPLPDAVHLELVRRLNLAAGAPVVALAERVLGTASPGRGLVDVPLPWPEDPRRFGSPAIDPAHLPEDELIRLATGVIVHLLPGVARPAAPPRPARWPVPWRRRFRLHGAPGTVAAVRSELLSSGLVETDWRPTHVVIARPVEVMMAEQWAANAQAGGILKWSALWRRAEAADHLPPPLDVTAIARVLEGRRREQVHVVVARDAQEACETTARLLGARSSLVSGTGDLAATDLLRRVNRLTALTQGPGMTADLAARLASVIDEAPAVPGAAPAPFVPEPALPWARQQSAAMAQSLRSAGYAVHGNPDDLAPAGLRRTPSGTVDRGRTLELAVAACLRIWQQQGGTP